MSQLVKLRSLPLLRVRTEAATQVKCSVLVILPFTYRVVNSSWEADSFQRLLHSDAVVKQALTGKNGAVWRPGDSSVSAAFGSRSVASPAEGWKHYK